MGVSWRNCFCYSLQILGLQRLLEGEIFPCAIVAEVCGRTQIDRRLLLGPEVSGIVGSTYFEGENPSSSWSSGSEQPPGPIGAATKTVVLKKCFDPAR
jgi:hypothetical protein